MKCPIDWVDAAAEDQLVEKHEASLAAHLSQCETCRRRLQEQTASRDWWNDASRFLDESVLSDPQCDASDSSSCDARLFDDDDPMSQLRSIGAIEPAGHPEMLGQLGRYTIEREIGAGGMGVVVKAHDSELNRMVAIKVLAPHLARSGTAKQRFIREGRAAAAVVHENVVAIHEVDTTATLPYLVMRYVDGISLQRHVDLYGPLSVFDALRIASQAATGLAAAHRQGIIHRDVKPANILINHTCSRTWISDFGLARAVDDASLTRTGFIAGTPHYMSPEQARGGDIGPRSDLFSLGAVMYFMFTGRPPWRAERSLAVLHRIVSQPHRPLWKYNAQIPRRVSDLVDRLLSKNVSDRPASAADVQTELERVLSEMQNPESYPADTKPPLTGDSQTALPQTAWYGRPWFVAPITSLVTVAACLLLGLGRLPDAPKIKQTANATVPFELLQEPVSQYAASSNTTFETRNEYDQSFPQVPKAMTYSEPTISKPAPSQELLTASAPSPTEWAPPPTKWAPSAKPNDRSPAKLERTDNTDSELRGMALPPHAFAGGFSHTPPTDPTLQEIEAVEALLRDTERFMRSTAPAAPPSVSY
ncbi:serine/threonine-protein kinase [Roseiconus lacunae]|uniref:serine/threonine-protein kinase n=1 Tax=Roseiconus lacunae TaxID=2605694 RepID=UPI001E33FDCB|nr:serine/threonine-protein kinase [Roseiconus lacunae]MCD0461552.1 protein kinase [Roseiconus lacunae]